MWVKVTGLLTQAERKELYDELDDKNVPVYDESWPALRLLQSILNEEDSESGEFYGHHQTGWMYFKDAATLILRRFRNVRGNPKMKDLHILWKYILTLVEPNFHNEKVATMEVLMLRKDVTRQMTWKSIWHGPI